MGSARKRNSVKTELHEFDLYIYPRKIWICIGGTQEGIKQHLHSLERTELDFTHLASFNACVFQCRSKATDNIGELIWFPHKKSVTYGIVAHEAIHAALDVCADIDLRIDAMNQEPFAYLVGYIADCIEKVKNNRF